MKRESSSARGPCRVYDAVVMNKIGSIDTVISENEYKLRKGVCECDGRMGL